MPAKRKGSSHIKIWEAHYGPVPRESDGRAYEIHHIDGDHTNNSIENLSCITLKEHYDIHYTQGDWSACLTMAKRMGISHREKSDLARKAALERIKDGTHHFLGPDNNLKRIEEGTHHFLDGGAAKKRNCTRVEQGTHNLLKRPDGTSQSGDRVAAGTHHLVTNNPVYALLNSGRHASKIRVCCIYCRGESPKNQFTRVHSNCGVQ